MSELLERLTAAANAMAGETIATPAELLYEKPRVPEGAAEAWSAMEVACHVEEFIPFWTEQTLRVVGGEGEGWGRTHADERRLTAVALANARTPASVAAGIVAAAGESARLLGALSDEELAREAVSRNPRWGLKPASFIVRDLLTEHVEKHLGQMRRALTSAAKK